MLDYILALLAQITSFVQTLAAGISAQVSALVQSAYTWISDLMSSVSGALSGMIRNIGSFIQQIAQGVLAQISETLGPILNVLASIAENVRDFLAEVYNNLRDVVINLWTKVSAAIQEVLDNLWGLMRQVFDTVQTYAQTVLDTVVAAAANVYEDVKSIINRALDAIANVASRILESVSAGVNRILADARANVAATERVITQGWQTLVTGAESLVESIDRRLQDVREGMADIARTLAEQIGAFSEETGAALREGTEGLLDKLLGLMSLPDLEKEVESLGAIIHSPDSVPADRQAIAQYLQKLLPTTKFGRAVALSVFFVIFAAQIWSGIGTRYSDILVQEWNAQYPTQILSADQMIAAYMRGYYDDATLPQLLARHGYSANASKALVAASQSALAPFEAVAAWRRGLLDTEALHKGIKAAGIAPEWQEALIGLTEVIPPVSDLIHMAVREAFSPEISERFGQYEDYPAELDEWLKKQGLSPEWGKRYWAAHWGLPSVTMALEMYHRRVAMRDGEPFSDKDLDLLLRAQDIMPFWREAIKQIAYKPYGRVDVRRMHKVGVLKDGDLLKAYLDLGYDAEHAKALADFTIRLNTPSKPETADELGRLTRANIIGFYRDQLLPRERAQALLQDLGISAEAAAMYLAAADLAEEKERRSAESTAIHELVVAGELSTDEALVRLSELGFSEPERLSLLAKIEREIGRKIKLPTRAEGEAMVLAGVLDMGRYRQLLATLGYGAQWVDAYVGLAEHKRREGKA